MRKIDFAAQLASEFVGCPYVFAATGQTCTPTLRKNRAAAKPAYADAIYKYCPVLNGSKSSCSGCKYNGKRAFDCRGLTYVACKEAGLTISSVGATTQYNSNTWIEKGTIDKMPTNTPCIVFKQSATNKNTMQHTGFNLGDGYCVDCREHATGTVKRLLSSYPWTHYAIPKGAYDEADAPIVVNQVDTSGTRATLRKGSKGDDVKTLQETLLSLGYSLPKHGADGDFGSETETAVKEFQRVNGLTVDGICGCATWAKLDALSNPLAPAETEEPPVKFTVTIQGLSAAETTYLLDSYPGAIAVENIG